MARRLIAGIAAKYFVNPIIGRVAGLVPGYALLETTGRKTQRPIRTPISDGLHGSTFWLVAEHGRSADYVKNLIANPEVRVRTHRRWRKGTAQLLLDDDPVARLKSLNLSLNAVLVRGVGTDLTTIRIDLEE